MNDKNKEDLLHDICGDAASEPFRAEMLEVLLHQARRKKRTRQVGQVGLVTACLVILAISTLQNPPAPTPIISPAMENTWLVHSVPLSPEMIIKTKAEQYSIITSSPDTLVVIHSAPAKDLFSVINDEELFGLLEGSPAALVRNGNEVELVFAHPSDEKKFLAGMSERGRSEQGQ